MLPKYPQYWRHYLAFSTKRQTETVKTWRFSSAVKCMRNYLLPDIFCSSSCIPRECTISYGKVVKDWHGRKLWEIRSRPKILSPLGNVENPRRNPIPRKTLVWSPCSQIENIYCMCGVSFNSLVSLQHRSLSSPSNFMQRREGDRE